MEPPLKRTWTRAKPTLCSAPLTAGSVEGSNAEEIRHYLGRLHRKSRCFCRDMEALRQAFWLFVYGYNQYYNQRYNKRCLFRHNNPKLKRATIGIAQFLTAIV